MSLPPCEGGVTTVTFEERGGKTLLVMHELYPSKGSSRRCRDRGGGCDGRGVRATGRAFSSPWARAWDGHELVDLAVGRLAFHYAEENHKEVLDDKTEAVICELELLRTPMKCETPVDCSIGAVLTTSACMTRLRTVAPQV